MCCLSLLCSWSHNLARKLDQGRSLLARRMHAVVSTSQHSQSMSARRIQCGICGQFRFAFLSGPDKKKKAMGALQSRIGVSCNEGGSQTQGRSSGRRIVCLIGPHRPLHIYTYSATLMLFFLEFPLIGRQRSSAHC